MAGLLDYWIVTKIDGVYRPLAGVRRGELDVPTEEVSATFIWIKTILSDPANRISIEAERDMAKDCYVAGDMWWVSIFLFEGPANLSNRTLGIEDEFPFISRCLLLGICHQRAYDLYMPQKTQPLALGSVYNPACRSSNIVVCDITDLNDLRGGIMLPGVMPTQPYVLFPASNFVKRFGCMKAIGDIRTLERLTPIDPSVINFIQIPKNTVHIPRAFTPDEPPLDRLVIDLIEKTVEVNIYEEKMLDILRGLSSLRGLLQRHLCSSGPFGQTPSAGQFIGLAFAGETHVDLVRFRSIPVEAIEFAFGTRDMSNTKSLSLRVDYILGSAIGIVGAVSKLTSLRHLYCFRGPGPGPRDCVLSRELYMLFAKRLDLLQRMEVTFNASFSLSLKDMPWTGSPLASRLTSACHPPSQAVPVQHMFIRRSQPAEPGVIDPILWTASYYLAHGLLRPEAFAAKFLRYLWQPPERLAPFSAEPPSLKDMSDIEIRPLVEWTNLQGISKGAWVLLLSMEGIEKVQTRRRDAGGNRCPRAQRIPSSFGTGGALGFDRSSAGGNKGTDGELGK
ncbi:hypothetical protein F5Y00DRAFT_264428 [Daldinia vernicosa]|uniref:uncharacterized protein n=1 Tax=Daldinia vernicosa TaxID=114800 RepID=UPI0020079425|nr:uncharacterized protein F5Y00DRAFT_264428 [Daldinia vernicosa]KAI0846616.1 hypothetical protein F5Y00DRAFT_264428 [Daldinia vernicosa]